MAEHSQGYPRPAAQEAMKAPASWTHHRQECAFQQHRPTSAPHGCFIRVYTPAASISARVPSCSLQASTTSLVGGMSAGGQDATRADLVTLLAVQPRRRQRPAWRAWFYNTDLDNPIDTCSSDWKPISLNGGYADFESAALRAVHALIRSSIYNNIVIFNDPDYAHVDPTLKSVTLNGGGSNFDFRGVVYSPRGQVYVQWQLRRPRPRHGGGAPEFTLDQVIAYKYTLNGNGGSILGLQRPGNYCLRAARRRPHRVVDCPSLRRWRETPAGISRLQVIL